MESSLRHGEKMWNPAGVPWRALAGSLVLHWLALAMLVPAILPESLQTAPQRALTARLLPVQIPAASPVAAAQPEPDRKPVVQREAKSPDPVPAPAPAVLPAPTFAAEPAPAARSDRALARNESSAPANVAPPEIRSDAGPDAAGLRQYRLSLAGEAKRFRRYPEAARREGLSGTAEIRVAVTAGERLAELSRSSGHAVLDAAALDMLQQAATRAQLPESLRGRQFAVLMPVVFEVEE